ncbi:MAG: hypothetical protein ACK4OO_02460 [bacterium]
MLLGVEAWGGEFRPLSRLVDCPSAGGPLPGWTEMELRFFPDGGVLGSFSLGIFSRLWVGISYGGDGIIGYSVPQWNPQPGVSAAFRLVNESLLLPAVALGFSNQGYGSWVKDEKRYFYRAKGVYILAAKNFAFPLVGEWGWHLGVNRNQQEGDGEEGYFAGLSFRPIPLVEVIGEFSSPWKKSSSPRSLSLNRGTLNAALRWTVGSRMAVDLIVHDLLLDLKADARGGKSVGRELRILYREPLLAR